MQTENADMVKEVLDLVERPLFFTKNGVVTYANFQAHQLGIERGTEVATLLQTGQQEYTQLGVGDDLYLTVEVWGKRSTAHISRRETYDVVTLLEYEEGGEIRALALAAQKLRIALNGVLHGLDRSDPKSEAEREAFGSMQRGLHQMMRQIYNMSDVPILQSGEARMEYLDLYDYLSEIFEKSQDAAETAGHKLYCSIPSNVNMLSMVDIDKVERAYYNMLSNAIKFSPENAPIRVQVSVRDNTLYLTMANVGEPIPDEVRSTLFHRYSREPGMEDPRYGLGLGLPMIAGTAALHGGAMLLERTETGGTRVTMTIKLIQPTASDLRSPTARMDYAGDRDHALLELSDVLPSKRFNYV